MSTKTTFKRIALVAVAALGFGMLSVVPSFAATYTPTMAVNPTTGTVGTAVNFTVLITGASTPTAADVAVTTPVLTGTAATTLTAASLVPTNTLVNMTSSVLAGVVTDTTTATAAATASHAYTFTPDAVGTYVLTFTTVTGGVSATAAVLTVTVAGVVGGVYATGDSTGALVGKPTAAGTAGANNFVTLTTVATGNTNSTNVVVTGSTANVAGGSTAGYVSGTGTSSVIVSSNSSTSTSVGVLNIPTPTVGTITVNSYPIVNGVQSATATSTVTITVAAAAIPATTYSASTAFIANVAGTDLIADGTTLTAASTSSDTPVGVVTVSQYATTSATTRLLDANSKAVTVTITGAGTVGSGATPASNRGPSTTVAAAAAETSYASLTGMQNFPIYADGRSGPATIVITVNGAVVATKTFTFIGAFSQYKTVSVQAGLLGVGATEVTAYTGADSFGSVVAIAGTTAATSSDTLTATVVVVGNSMTVTAVASGTAVITVTNGATPAITTTRTYTVTKTTAKTVTMSFDKAEYTAGEKMVLTVTALDSNGKAVADGARDLFAANVVATVNLITVTTLPQVSVTLLAGKATYTMYAPLATGPITVSSTEGAGTDNVIALGTAAAITATATVVSDGVAQAAADAAAEATDAANAATDAANAAAEAADAATAAAQDAADAVAALSVSVAAMIDALKKQITALTNLVIKIQKKVKA